MDGAKEEKKRYYRANSSSPPPWFVKFVIFVGANRDPCFIFMRRVLAYSRHKLLSTARVGSNRYNATVAEFIRWQGADHGAENYTRSGGYTFAPHLSPRHRKSSHCCRFLSTMQIPQPRAVFYSRIFTSFIDLLTIGISRIFRSRTAPFFYASIFPF